MVKYLIDRWNGNKKIVLTGAPGEPTFQCHDPKRVDKRGKMIPRYREVTVTDDGRRYKYTPGSE